VANSLVGNSVESAEETNDTQPLRCNVLRAVVGQTEWSPYNSTSDSDLVLGVVRIISSGIASSAGDEQIPIDETEPHHETEAFTIPNVDEDDFVMSTTDESTEVEATSPLNIPLPPQPRRRGMFSRIKKWFRARNGVSSSTSTESSIFAADENIGGIEVGTEEEERPSHVIEESAPVLSGEDAPARSGEDAPVRSDEEDRSSFVDTNVVMTCLSERVHTESKYIISVHDFEGQFVFNVSHSSALTLFLWANNHTIQAIHSFFLTKQSICCVVFDMCQLANDDENRLKCLENIKFWINSIVMHTYDRDTDKTSKIFLVGTRKGAQEVSDVESHAEISKLLKETFHNYKLNIAWKNFAEYELKNLCFYPLTNTQDDPDETLLSLRQEIDNVIEEYGHVNVERPLSYLKTLDAFKLQDNACLTFLEASSIAQVNGVPSDDVKSMLKLFHEAGRVTYHGKCANIYSECCLSIYTLPQMSQTLIMW
jgi:hypothetical protein